VDNLAFAVKVECSRHFPAPGRDSMPDHQTLQDFSNMSQVLLQKKQWNQLTYSVRGAENYMSLYLHTLSMLFKLLNYFFLKNFEISLCVFYFNSLFVWRFVL
jgi:hypothetical protein